MDKISISVPPVSQMRIKHFRFILELNKLDGRKPTDAEMVKMLSLFTGESEDLFLRAMRVDNHLLFETIVKAFAKHKLSEDEDNKQIPLELTYNDVTYTFRDDFTKMPTGWFVDFSFADFEKNPVDMLSFCFIEKGMTYAEVDKNKNIINPRSKRNEVFEQHVPLPVYLNVNAFFLSSWNTLERYLTADAKERLRQSIFKDTTGKILSTLLPSTTG